MRPNNQNNQNKQRSRGRSGGGRSRHGSPLSRNYESNGPEVKIRGNASTVAEKYLQLARDAQGSGDSVMEQNYLQHAEHYFRIVSAAQAQNPQRSEPQGQQPTIQGEAKPDSVSGDKPESAVGAEPATSAVVSPEGDATEVVEEAAEAVERPERKPRERRPRRKPRVQEAASENPADAPQPDVGDLPAFLTGGGQPDAAE